MGAGQAAMRAFAAAIEAIWWSIDQDIIDDLIKSMDSRVNHVLAAEGWQTKY